MSHHGDTLPMTLPEKGVSVPPIKQYNKTGAVLEGGEQINFDSVIFCTGYSPRFSFMDESCKMNVKDRRVGHLYKMIIHTQTPNLFFMGMYYYNSFPRLAATQAKFMLSYLKGTADVPSLEKMEEEVEEEFAEHIKSGQAPKLFHQLAYNQAKYADEIARLGNFEPGKKVYWKMLDKVLDTLLLDKDMINMRTRRFEAINDDDFEVIQD